MIFNMGGGEKVSFSLIGGIDFFSELKSEKLSTVHRGKRCLTFFVH